MKTKKQNKRTNTVKTNSREKCGGFLGRGEEGWTKEEKGIKMQKLPVIN